MNELEGAALVAGVEQDLTEFDGYLDKMIEVHRENASDHGATQSLMGLVSVLDEYDRLTVLALFAVALNRLTFPTDNIDLEQLVRLPDAEEPQS